MRSLIILEVEHGEDTDRMAHMITHILNEYNDHMETVYPGRPVVNDYTVKVDLPPCFVLDSRNNDADWCPDADNCTDTNHI